MPPVRLALMLSVDLASSIVRHACFCFRALRFTSFVESGPSARTCSKNAIALPILPSWLLTLPTGEGLIGGEGADSFSFDAAVLDRSPTIFGREHRLHRIGKRWAGCIMRNTPLASASDQVSGACTPKPLRGPRETFLVNGTKSVARYA